MYYPINENTARLSHQMMSMSDYKEGSATAGYRAAVDEAAALVERQKQKVSPFYHEKLDALLDRYARRLAQWTNDYNRNGAMSAFFRMASRHWRIRSSSRTIKSLSGKSIGIMTA